MIKSSITRSITVLFVLIASVALISADWLVSAQNSNSSTQDEQTRGGMMTSQNTNTSGTGSSRRRRRGRRRAPASTAGDMTGEAGNANMAGDTSTPSGDMQNANMAGETGNANMTGTMGGGRRRRRRGRRSSAAMPTDTTGAGATQTTGGAPVTGRRCEIDPGTQTDLGGQSYTGTAEYPDGGVNGRATLEFQSGGQFSLTPEGGTALTGRYSAVTSCGYIGVTMMFTGTPATIVSVRLRKVGNGVSIKSVPGENRQFSFTSSGGGGARSAGKHRRRRGKRGGSRGGIKPPMTSPEPSATP